jgi:hypothetical protein
MGSLLILYAKNLNPTEVIGNAEIGIQPGLPDGMYICKPKIRVLVGRALERKMLEYFLSIWNKL